MTRLSATLRILAVTGLVLTTSQCTMHRTAKYEEGMADLRQQVKIGDDIFEAEKRIKDRYHYVTEPYDPTKLGKVLWMNVDFGLQPTFVETIAYTADIEPIGDNKPISAIVVADPSGTVTAIK